MGEQIVDTTPVAAAEQHSSAGGKEAIKAGNTATEIWPGEPATVVQEDIATR